MHVHTFQVGLLLLLPTPDQTGWPEPATQAARSTSNSCYFYHAQNQSPLTIHFLTQGDDGMC